ncbi:hypothetical protein MKW94_016656 [Papaver nudicaule]|uniref:Small ribosomal subunit protein uS10 domain-containing protein n=1 Tax=Papaver nudicaule TaxID=74823 RepID=A0AA41S3V9_PAPNU|nr:hypothetical protein [Papaver nudicaule]
MASSSSASILKTLPILPSSNSTLSSNPPKPSTISVPSNISRLPSLKSKHSFRDFPAPELFDTLRASEQPFDRASFDDYKVTAGSEIHGTPKISIEDDYVDKIKLTPKIRIKLRSYYVPLIEESCKLIMDAARTSNTKTIGPVYLPTKKRIYCVLKSPHGHKDARFHFEIRTHQRLIDILHPTEQTLESLMRLEFPPAVDVDVKL